MTRVWQPTKMLFVYPPHGQAQLYPMMNPNLSYENSAAFVKSLTHAALSTIVYQRGILNDQCFNDAHLFGVEVKLLKEESELPCAIFVTSSLVSAFDAFDRKYLHELVFSVHEDEDVCRPESRVESYSFQFQYHGSSTYVSLEGQGNTSNSSSTDALQRLHDMSNVMITRAYESAMSEAPRPAKFWLQFDICYNKSKPTEYYLPMRVGMQYKIRRRYYKHNEEVLLPSRGQLASVSTHSHSLIMKKYSAAASMIGPQPLLQANTVDNALQSQVLPVEPMTGQQEGHEHEPAPRELYCLCGADTFGDDVITSLCIRCMYCGMLQHAVCYDWKEEENVTYHCCVECALEEPKRYCTNPILLLSDTNTIKAMCVLRLTVEWCTFACSVTARLFAKSFNMTDDDLKKLISKIEHYGILKPLTSTAHDTMDAERPVNKAAAKELIKRGLSRMQTASVFQPMQLVYQKETQENTNPCMMFQRSDSPILKPMPQVQTGHQNKGLGQNTTNRKDPASVFEFNGEDEDSEIEEPWRSGWHNRMRTQQLSAEKRKSAAALSRKGTKRKR